MRSVSLRRKFSITMMPSDGLVVTYNDIAYGRSLGRTAKFPRDSIAFKWQDETRETILAPNRVEPVTDRSDQSGCDF